jgi:hypothetical protein
MMKFFMSMNGKGDLNLRTLYSTVVLRFDLQFCQLFHLSSRIMPRSTKTYGGGDEIIIKKRSISASTIKPYPCKNSRSLSPVDVLQWDDVNCRPIFEISSSGPENFIEEESRKVCTPPRVDASDDWSLLNLRRRKRSYESRALKTFFPKDERPAPIRNVRRNNLTSRLVKECNRSNVEVTATSSAFFRLPQPNAEKFGLSFEHCSPCVKSDNSICEDLKGYECLQLLSLETRNACSNTSETLKKDILKGRSFKKLKEGNVQEIDSRASDLSRQPTSTTSISTAKAYFDKLDAIELSLDTSSSPQDHPIRCGRSQKRINLCDVELQKEYKYYCFASKESGISPISLNDYAKSRSDIFRRNEIFDGFLDL